MRIYRVHPAELDRRPVIKSSRVLTASEQDELRTLFGEGWRVDALMVRFDVSRRTVYRYLEGELLEGRVGPYTATFWLRRGFEPQRIERWRASGVTLIDAIPAGRSKARRKLDLARDMGWTTRAVEAEIERLRKSGEAAICSGGEGYWRPLTMAEYAENIDGRRRRAVGQLVTVRGERRILRAWHQTTLWAAA